MKPKVKGAEPEVGIKPNPVGAPKKPQTIENMPDPDGQTEGQAIRSVFARSLCAAHHLASAIERESCDDGLPCAKLSECLSLADKTLVYLEYRNRLPKND